MAKKKINKVERTILELTSPGYNSYRCATHGVFQHHDKHKDQGVCPYQKGCTSAVETIKDPVAYAKAN